MDGFEELDRFGTLDSQPEDLDFPQTEVIKIDDAKRKQLSECFGTENNDLIEYFLKESLYFESTQNKEESFASNLNSTLGMLKGIAPQDELEGMLAVQMVYSHKLAMNFLKRASAQDKSPEIIDLQLRRANKLMNSFSKQMQTLTKYRQKGQQKMVVEHVNVNAGGQAIIGTIEGGLNEK
jgi:hypothetical protein